DPAFIGSILAAGLSLSEFESLFTNNQWAGPEATGGSFDLVYVPEPAGLVLLAIGCGVVALRRRKA
ncbi:MAG: PEP-CTERM sorting domain-containing protein, partial [Planctomycetota bacterium]